jgi:hypothetical protein
MDGLSEQMNQWVEQYLQLVTSTNLEDWTHWLTIASVVHNNWINQTLGMTPNQVLLGYDVNLFLSENLASNNPSTDDWIKTLMDRCATAVEAINCSAWKSMVIPSQYQKGVQVWLEVVNLKIKHQKTKLAPKRYGPFMIEREISPVAYQLQLPASWGIHDVFHASLLSPYHETAAHGPNFLRPPLDLIDGQEEYEVERIISHQRHGRSKQLQYLIKWVGYPHHDNTWELASQVHALDLVKAYHHSNPLEGIKTLRTSPLQCQLVSTTPLPHYNCPIQPRPLSTLLSPTWDAPPLTSTQSLNSSSSPENPSTISGSTSCRLTRSTTAMPFSTPTFAKTTRAPSITPTERKNLPCPA